MKHLFLTLGLWTIVAGFTSCVVKEREYPRHHDHVYIEHEPVVEERVVVR